MKTKAAEQGVMGKAVRQRLGRCEAGATGVEDTSTGSPIGWEHINVNVCSKDNVQMYECRPRDSEGLIILNPTLYSVRSQRILRGK